MLHIVSIIATTVSGVVVCLAGACEFLPVVVIVVIAVSHAVHMVRSRLTFALAPRPTGREDATARRAIFALALSFFLSLGPCVFGSPGYEFVGVG